MCYNVMELMRIGKNKDENDFKNKGKFDYLRC